MYPYFCPCPTALWTFLQLERASTIEMNTDWKFLQIYNSYIFMDLKRPINRLKSKITKIEEIENKTVNIVWSKVYTNFLQEMFYSGRERYLDVNSRGLCEFGPKNDVHYRVVSTVKCMRVWESFYPFLRKVLVVGRCLL